MISVLEITLIRDREKEPEICNFSFKLLLTADILLCGLREATRTTFIDCKFLHIALQLSSQIFDFLFQVLFACSSFYKRLACFRELLCLANKFSCNRFQCVDYY